MKREYKNSGFAGEMLVAAELSRLGFELMLRNVGSRNTVGYDMAAACHKTEYGGGSASPFLSERCPGCRADLFRSVERGLQSLDAKAWMVRLQALAELQRMHRAGIATEGTRLVLVRPKYWETMLPPMGRNEAGDSGAAPARWSI